LRYDSRENRHYIAARAIGESSSCGEGGEASSVSGYIAEGLAEKEQRESLRALVDELKAEHGTPNKREIAWARRALSRRRHK
jgi:hypothetical protein